MSPISHCHISEEVVEGWWSEPPEHGDYWTMGAVESLETEMYFERYPFLVFSEGGEDGQPEVFRLLLRRVRRGLDKWDVVARYVLHG